MRENNHKFKHIFVILGALLIAWGIFLFFPDNQEKFLYKKTDKISLEESKNPFNELALEARSVIVWDVAKQESLFSISDNAQLPLASLTKIMTAFLVKKLLPEGQIITVERNSIIQEGDTGLLVGEQWDREKLIDFTLLSSSNDGAHALAAAVVSFEKKLLPLDNQESADELFEILMNREAKAIGLKQTFFINESGLDAAKKISGAYGSAFDVAKLFEYILSTNPELLEATPYEKQNIVSLDGIVHSVTNTNIIVESIPGITASKTGFTELAGGNLVIAFETSPVHPIIIVVLGSTLEGRFEDVKKLVDATIEHFSGR